MTENIGEYEKIILEIIQNYLNKNRCFRIEQIVPFIKLRLKESSINLNRRGIREILGSLIKKKKILERSKLVRDDVLNNMNRRKIFNFICENPGVNFNKIAKKLQLSNYVLAWHIKILIKFEFIRTKVIKNHETFFNADLPTDKDEEFFYISNEKSKIIINYLIQNQEGCHKTQIGKDLNMHSSTVLKYVNKLEKYRILLKKQLSRKKIYFLNESVYSKIMGSRITY